MRETNKKIITLILVITFVFSPALAVPAQAQWVVWDPGNFVPNTVTAVNTTIVAGTQIAETTKEYGLDAVFFIIGKLIIQRIAASTVKWINSGFQGGPAFVTNPEAYFGNMGDQIAGQFIFSNPNLNFLCGPIQAKIRLALANNYNNQDRTRWQCTLTQVGKNMDDFMNNFENGGWDSFFEISQKQQNNPIGAYLQAEGSLAQQIATKTGLKKDDLLQGKGLMSFTECTQYGVATKRTVEEGGRFELQPDGTNKYIAGTTREVTDPPPCIKEKTNTPGSVISDQLNKTLGAGTDALVTADEMNEIVSALLTQLLSKVMGGIGGLLGTSNPSSTGEKAFTGQLASSTAMGVTDYFGNTPNTKILDEPILDPSCLDQSDNPSAPYYDIDPSVCANPVNLNAGKPTCSPQTDPTCVWEP